MSALLGHRPTSKELGAASPSATVRDGGVGGGGGERWHVSPSAHSSWCLTLLSSVSMRIKEEFNGLASLANWLEVLNYSLTCLGLLCLFFIRNSDQAFSLPWKAFPAQSPAQYLLSLPGIR